MTDAEWFITFGTGAVLSALAAAILWAREWRR